LYIRGKDSKMYVERKNPLFFFQKKKRKEKLTFLGPKESLIPEPFDRFKACTTSAGRLTRKAAFVGAEDECTGSKVDVAGRLDMLRCLSVNMQSADMFSEESGRSKIKSKNGKRKTVGLLGSQKLGLKCLG
jgi:hypothetical protein